MYGLTFDVHLLKRRPLHSVLFDCISYVYHRSLSFIYWLFIVRSFCHFILWYSYSLSLTVLYVRTMALAWIWREREKKRSICLIINRLLKEILSLVCFSLSVGSSIDSFLAQKSALMCVANEIFYDEHSITTIYTYYIVLRLQNIV